MLESADLREGIKANPQWPDSPQSYVKGEFVGGCDIVREMFQAGELARAAAGKGHGGRICRVINPSGGAIVSR